MEFENEREVVMVCGYMLGIVPVLEIPYTPEDTTLSILKYCDPILNICPGTIVPEVTLDTYRLELLVTESFTVMVCTAVFGL
jgi:hypothetical protein